MWQLIRRLSSLSAILVLTSCASSMTVHVQCEPPPLPASILLPCPVPAPLPDAKMQTVTEALLEDRNPGGVWAQCIRQNDQLIALVKYQMQVCSHLQSLNRAPPKQWYEFWR